jgi:hypothetical protein
MIVQLKEIREYGSNEVSRPALGVADRGYSGHKFREHIWSIGANPAIPAKSNEAPVA